VPTDWVDANGEQLSDHLPVSALFEIQFVPEPGLLALLAPALAALLRRNCNRM
jgi:hypothetical protein